MNNNWKLGNLFSILSSLKSPIVLVIATLGIAAAGFLAFQRFQSSSSAQQEPLLVEPIKTVTTLGRLEPRGEVIQISASGNNIQGGNRVEQLLVKEVSFGLYALTRNATNLPLYMTLIRAIQVQILTLIMCMISGAVATRKVQSADPADMF